MRLDEAAIEQAAGAIARGLVVCFPTETFYGLAVDARSEQGLARLDAIKGDRALESAYGLIVPSTKCAATLTAHWPTVADRLAAEHWPGPLTLVLPAASGLPGQIVGPGGGVGMRVSSHPWAHALATAVGGPITATSANPSAKAPATTVDQARGYFGASVAVYLDGGAAGAARPSTVLAIDSDGSVEVLRQGAVAIASPLTSD